MVKKSTTISNYVDDLAQMTIILATPNKINKQNPKIDINHKMFSLWLHTGLTVVYNWGKLRKK